MIGDFIDIIKLRIRKLRFCIWNEIVDKGNKKIEKLGDSSPCMDYMPPTTKEVEKRRKSIIRVIIIIVFGIFLSILAICLLKYYSTWRKEICFKDWNSSAGSFWGGVLGGLIACVTSFCTTFLLIQRSYKIDYHRERIEAMPVFYIEAVSTKKYDVDVDKREISIKDSDEKRLEVLYGTIDDVESWVCVVSIKNIGNGNAYRVKPQGFCEECDPLQYEGLLPKERELWIVYSPIISEENDKFWSDNCSVTYFDSYENMYDQRFEITYSRNMICKVVASPPELIKKTERVRYVQ